MRRLWLALLALPAIAAAQPACDDLEPVDVTRLHLKDNPIGDFCNRFIITTTVDGEPIMFIDHHSIHRSYWKDLTVEEGTTMKSVSVVDANGVVVCNTATNPPKMGSGLCYAPKVRTGTYVATVNGTRFSNRPRAADPAQFLGYVYGVVTSSKQISEETSAYLSRT